jgi:uncharacterized protein (TIGR03437 family)
MAYSLYELLGIKRRFCLCAALSLLACMGLFAQVQQYTMSTIAGAGAVTTTPARGTDLFIGVGSLATDAAGNVYFSFGFGVFKLDQNGVVTQIAGTSRPGFSGDGGPATNAQLNGAEGLAMDGAGNLFFFDLGNFRLRRIAPSGTIATVAGNGAMGTSGDGGPAVNAGFGGAYAMAADNMGNVFVAGGYRVRKVSVTGIVTTIAGNGTAGFSGDGGPATSAQISGVDGLVADLSGNLYLADTNNLRVRKVAPDGSITTVVGSGQWGCPNDGDAAASAPLLGPTGLAMDRSGNLYITDIDGDDELSAVRKVSPDGMITTIAGGGYFGFGGDGGPATNAQLAGPEGVAVDSDGNLYIGDTYNQRIRKISPAGIITTVAGKGVPAPSTGDGVDAFTADIDTPWGVAVDASGDLLIASSSLQRITPDGIIHTIGAGGNAVTQDATGNLFTAGLAIRELFPNGAMRTVASPGGFGTPGVGGYGIALDSGGDLLVGSGYLVSKISPSGVVTTVAGGGKDSPGDGGQATNAFLNNVTGVVFDRAGNLFFSETYGNRVRKMTPDGIITTIAGTGMAGYSGDEGPATSAQLGGPDGLAFDAAGNLYIADTYNSLIRVVTTDGTIHTIAGTPGLRGYYGDGGPAVLAQLNYPWSVAVDGAGNIVVADTFNGLVRELRPSHTSVLIGSVVDAASLLPGPVSPGKLVVLSGGGLGPAQPVQNQPSGGQIGTSLGGTAASFNGIPAPVLSSSSTKIAAIAPYSITGVAAQVTVSYNGQTSPPFSVPVAPSAPGIFTAGQIGSGQIAAIQVADGSANSATNPAKIGSYISFYVTGEGQTSPSGIDGKVNSLPAPKPLLDVAVTIGGVPAAVQYAGGSPGQIAGLMQINVQIPNGVAAGGYVPVIVRIGDASTAPDAAWIAISEN